MAVLTRGKMKLENGVVCKKVKVRCLIVGVLLEENPATILYQLDFLDSDIYSRYVSS